MIPFDWPLRVDGSRRACRCFACGQEIDASAQRLTRVGYNEPVHIECARRFWPYAIPLRNLERALSDADIAQIQLRREAIESQHARRVILRGKSSASAVQRPALAAVQPLRDERGCPIVRLYVDGTANPNAVGHAPRIGSSNNNTLRSPKRTYLVHVLEDEPPCPEDPAIVTIGALVIVDTARRLSLTRARSIAALRAQGLSTPLLWIISKSRDRATPAEQQARAWLNNAGFTGDEAIALHTEDGGLSAIARLIDALDATLVTTTAPLLLTTSPEDIARARNADALATLEALIVDNDVEGVKKILQIAAKNSQVSAAETQQLIARRAAREVANDALRPAILALCALALRREDAQPLADWYASSAARARSFTRDHESATRTLVALADERVVPVLLAQFEQSKSPPLLRRMCDVLARSKSRAFDAAVIDALSPMSDRYPSADPRRKVSKELLAKLRPRVRTATRE